MAHLLSYLMVLVLFVSCGGSSSGGGGGSTSVLGIAATGAPISGGLVEIAGCTTTTNTAADGSFTIDPSSCGAAPYLVRVTDPATGEALLTIAHGAGRYNATPLSTLIVQQITNEDSIDDIFNEFDDYVEDLTEERVNNLESQLTQIFQAAGLTIANFLNAEFEADSSGIDGILDLIEVDFVGGNMVITLKPSSGFNGTLLNAGLDPEEEDCDDDILDDAEDLEDDFDNAEGSLARIVEAREAALDLLELVESDVASASATDSDHIGVDAQGNAAKFWDQDEESFLTAYDSFEAGGVTIVGVCDESVVTGCEVPSSGSFAELADADGYTLGSGYDFGTVASFAAGDMIQIRLVAKVVPTGYDEDFELVSDFYATFDGTNWVLNGTSQSYGVFPMREEILDFLSEAGDIDGEDLVVEDFYDMTDFVAARVVESGLGSATNTDIEPDSIDEFDFAPFEFDDDSLQILRVGRIGATVFSGEDFNLSTSNDDSTNVGNLCDLTLSDSPTAGACADGTDQIAAQAIVVEVSVEVEHQYDEGQTVSGLEPHVDGVVRMLLYKNLSSAGSQTPANEWRIRAIYKMTDGTTDRKMIP